MAREGRGVAFLPRTLIEDELAAGRLLEAGRPGWPIEVQLRLYRRAGTETPAAEAFWAAGDRA